MKLTYRPEIDGLRSIAVISVILYHAGIVLFDLRIFEGGFIGVDIFFVISGYLITSVILKELKETGSFSFKYFYERRIRRILPALLFVMFMSMPLAWMYLLPSGFIDFSKSILYSLGFSSNFYFNYTDQIYGAENGLLKPFLHTWSLSVEEQYYIIFPIFLLITFKYFKKYLSSILILGFLISLIMADWGSKNYPSTTFYFLHTRMWELIIGSILAYYEIFKDTKKFKQKFKVSLILPSLGVILVGYSMLFFNDKMFHPSFYTLAPIIGVCLIIFFSHKDELITKILSTKLFVGVGLISYSLYLWHYPIFAFSRIIEFTSGSLEKKIILGIVIFILSIFSYFFIERPARNKNYKFKTILIFIFLFLFFLIFTNSAIITKNGYAKRIPQMLQNTFVASATLFKEQNKKNCINEIGRCTFNSSSDKKVYIVGDSHVAALFLDLKERIVRKGYSFVTSNFGDCLYFPGFNIINKKTNKIDKNCNDSYFSQLEKEFGKNDNSIIIFGGRFPLYLTNTYFDNKEGRSEGGEWGSKFISTSSSFKTIQSSFSKSVNKLSKKNKIILIYPIPEAGWHVPRKILSQNSKYLISPERFQLEYISTSFKVYKERAKSSFKLLDSIQGDNIYRVYPSELFCDTFIKDRCATHDDKNSFYLDDDHPSIKGAEMINNLIIEKIQKLEKTK